MEYSQKTEILFTAYIQQKQEPTYMSGQDLVRERTVQISTFPSCYFTPCFIPKIWGSL